MVESVLSRISTIKPNNAIIVFVQQRTANFEQGHKGLQSTLRRGVNYRVIKNLPHEVEFLVSGTFVPGWFISDCSSPEGPSCGWFVQRMVCPADGLSSRWFVQ